VLPLQALAGAYRGGCPPTAYVTVNVQIDFILSELQVAATASVSTMHRITAVHCG